jgi:PAS domain S-box-containing protein
MGLTLNKNNSEQPFQEMERLRFLADVAFQMNQMKTSEEVADFICMKIKSIIGNGIVGATLLDETTQIADVKALRGLEDSRLISAALKIAGSDPRKVVMSITDIPAELMAIYNSGRLELIEGGFYTLFAGRYSKLVSQTIERFMNIPYVYAMGFLRSGSNIGGVAIFTDSEIGVEINKAMIEIIISHAADVMTRIRIEKVEADNNTRYKLMFESAPLAINITQGQVITYANPSYLKMFEYSNLDEVQNLPSLELFAEESRPYILENIRRQAAGLPVPSSYETVCVTKEGRKFPVILNVASASFADGPATVGFVMDITERKQAEEKIQSSLAEKELLLKEIHHRVKNNMQVISSMINMQGHFVSDEPTRMMLRETQQRIRTMALIYNKLYQSGDLAHIDMREYISEQVSSLVYTYALGLPAVKTEFDIDEIEFGLDIAVPCALIINEIVTNSLKYAFSDHRQGTVRVSLKKNDSNYVLSVTDNGVGLPPDFNPLGGRTLGMKLVITLIQNQLKGTFDIKRQDGTEFVVTFGRQHGDSEEQNTGS